MSLENLSIGPKGWCLWVVSVRMLTSHSSWPKPGSHLNISMLIKVYCGFYFSYNLVLPACKWRHCSFTGEENDRLCGNILAGLSTLCRKGTWSTIQFILLFPRESSSYWGTYSTSLWWEEPLGNTAWPVKHWSDDPKESRVVTRSLRLLAELEQVTDCLQPQISHPSGGGLAGFDSN